MNQEIVLGSEQHAEQVRGRQVIHDGCVIGTVTEIRRSVTNGRRYALVRALVPGDPERRIPLDELRLNTK